MNGVGRTSQFLQATTGVHSDPFISDLHQVNQMVNNGRISQQSLLANVGN